MTTEFRKGDIVSIAAVVECAHEGDYISLRVQGYGYVSPLRSAVTLVATTYNVGETVWIDGHMHSGIVRGVALGQHWVEWQGTMITRSVAQLSRTQPPELDF